MTPINFFGQDHNMITIPITLQLTISAGGQVLQAEQSAPAPVPLSTNRKTPPAPGEFWEEEGGYYICTLPAIQHLPARHLIAAQVEFEDLTFGPRQEISGAFSHVDGLSNTMALLAADNDHPAAQKAFGYNCDGTSAWHLPSRLDMFMAYLYAPHLFKKEGWYWTSTQDSSYLAFVQDFEGGVSHWSSKGGTYRVRPVRVIHL